jgi:hypothetical protein
MGEKKKTSDIFGQSDLLARNEANRAEAAKAWATHHNAQLNQPPQGLFGKMKQTVGDGIEELKLDWNEIGTADQPNAFADDLGERRRKDLLERMKASMRGGEPSEDLKNEWLMLMNEGKY